MFISNNTHTLSSMTDEDSLEIRRILSLSIAYDEPCKGKCCNYFVGQVIRDGMSIYFDRGHMLGSPDVRRCHGIDYVLTVCLLTVCLLTVCLLTV